MLAMEHDYPTSPSSQVEKPVRPGRDRLPRESTSRSRQSSLHQDLDVLEDPRPRLSLHDLEVINCLGIGTYGRVILVRVREDLYQSPSRSNAIFAIKIAQKKLVRNLRNSEKDEFNCERRALSLLPWNPFVTGVVDTFSDSRNLYFMLEVMPHGVFTNLIEEFGPFEPLTACFYYCNILCGLEFIHSHDLILRDLKPDNILVSHDGYLCLTDFGIAEHESRVYGWKLEGTSSYIAPELLENLEYVGSTVDWWASGVVLYEMLFRRMPFQGISEPAIFASILHLDYYWPDNKMGNSLKHFISRLLAFQPDQRLGFLGAEEVASHPWLSHVDWTRMKSRTYEAPWTPERTELPGKWHHHQVPSTVGDLGVKIPPVYLRWDKRYRQKARNSLDLS